MSQPHNNEAPKWWQLPWRVIGCFPLGAGILVYETIFETHAQTILVAAGLALCGVTGTGAIQQYIKRRLEE